MNTLPRLQIQNSRIVRTDDNTPIQLRGFGLGNWFLIEHFMIGLPSVEQEMRRLMREALGEERNRLFWKTYMDTYINEDDFQYMALLGVNFVRLAFNYHHFEDDLNPGVWKQEALDRFDQIIDWCTKHEIYVLLDLHAAAGCQDNSFNSDNKTSHMLMWEDKNYRMRSVILWRMLAERYKGNTTIMGYDLLNEPCPRNHEILRTYYREAMAAIRAIDSEPILVLEGDLWSKDIPSLSEDLFEDPQVMPSTHYYLTYEFATDQLDTYNSKWNGRILDKEWQRECLMKIADYSHINRPVLIGEFGPSHSDPEYIWQMYDDTISIFEECNMPWAFWHYKDVGTMGMLVSKPNTPWQKLINNPEHKATTGKLDELFKVSFNYGGGPEGSVAKELVAHFKDYNMHEVMARVSETRKHIDIFTLRQLVGRIAQANDEELIALASSFSLHNCEVHKPAEVLLKKYLQPKPVAT